MNRKTFHPIQCPSCKSTDKYRVSIGTNRIILDCQGELDVSPAEAPAYWMPCQYRLSLPFHNDELNGIIYRSMPLEFDEKKKVVD